LNLLKINKTAFVLLIFLATSFNIFAQQADSLNNINLSDTLNVPHKSPTGAILRSAILPGWGQIYNHSYWKAPIIWAFAGYFIYGWIQNNNLYKSYKNKYIASLPAGNYILKRYRDLYHDRRDLFAIYLGITYLLNIADAYVDAELFDFDFQFGNYFNGIQLNFRINLNAK